MIISNEDLVLLENNGWLLHSEDPIHFVKLNCTYELKGIDQVIDKLTVLKNTEEYSFEDSANSLSEALLKRAIKEMLKIGITEETLYGLYTASQLSTFDKETFIKIAKESF